MADEEIDRLANLGAKYLAERNPDMAIEYFLGAREIAQTEERADLAAHLLVLVARAWSLKGSASKALYASRRAVRERPDDTLCLSAFGHLSERAADDAQRKGKLRRATVLLDAAAWAWSRSAAIGCDETSMSISNQVNEKVHRLREFVRARGG